MKKTLLLVDDELFVLESLKRALNKEPYDILTANSAKDALEILKTHPVHVIISDQRMPYMTGSEFLSQVKIEHPETVRMVLSGFADFDAVTDAINKGAIYKFLTKPWKNAELKLQVRDAFQHYEMNWKLTHQMYYDRLTGFRSRLGFIEGLNELIKNKDEKTENIYVFHLNIEKTTILQPFIDAEVDEAFSIEMSLRLKKTIEKGLIGKMDEDNYCIAISEIETPEALDTFIKKLLHEFSISFVKGNHSIRINSSVGVSIYPQDGISAEQLVTHSVLAMQFAKNSGFNLHKFYNASLSIQSKFKLNFIADLSHALEKNEFVLHYQPQVKCDDISKIIGFEALLRWNHPQQGLVLPMNFIPIVETMDLIVPLSDWILKTACQQLYQWQQAGRADLCISVNLSSVQFEDLHLLEKIMRVLIEEHIKPNSLELEITESTLIKNVERGVQILQELKSLGVLLSIDDFGTGYSSLSYLQKFPLHQLKIDQSFIQKINGNSSSLAIVTSIITLGKSLGLEVIAEGVETQAQLDILKKLNCDLIQGYLISKPLDVEKCNKLLRIGL